ncbi:hypothetical protein Bca4012_085741 [Brassica carinata]
MERYNRVEKPKLASPIKENEIRITSVGLIRNYITYATTLLHEKCAKEIVLKAMGQAISKTVAISEILKNRVPGLHQDVTISSMSITDVFEPTEEGLVPVELTRHVSVIAITLSLSELNIDSPGYQAPAKIDQLKPKYQQQQPRQARLPYNAYGEGTRGRGRGRGRGGYGNYQGGYQGKYQGNYQEDYQENKGGYSDWGRGRGRGRSYGYRGDGYHGGRGGYGGGRDGGYGGRDDGYGGGREERYGGGRDEGYGGRRGGFRGGRSDKYGGSRDDGYSRGQGGYGYGGGRGGYGYGGGRGGYGYSGGRGDGYGGDKGYEGGRGGYGGGRGYSRGRGRMGNGGRSRGSATANNQNQA